MNLILLFAFTIFGLFSLFNKNNMKVLSIGIFAFMACLFIFSKGQADSLNYQYYFENINSIIIKKNLFNSYEYGWYYYVLLISKITSNYQVYLTITFLICSSLIFYTVREYSDNYFLFSVLFLIYPFIMEIINIRYFIAESIFIFSIPFLIKRKRLVYILLILLASTFHSLVLFFLLFCFSGEILNKYKKQFIIIYSSILIILICFARSSTVVSFFSNLVTGSKQYVFQTNSGFGFIAAGIILVINVFLFMWIYNMTKNKNNEISFSQILYQINLLSLGIGVLFLYNTLFERLFRGVLLLNFIYYSNILKKISIQQRTMLYIVIIITLLLNLWFYTIYRSFFYTIFSPIFLS